MNRLAAHVTPWRAWYAVLAVPAFLLGSFGALLSPPVSFVLFAALALLFIALASRRPPTPATSAFAVDSPRGTGSWCWPCSR